MRDSGGGASTLLRRLRAKDHGAWNAAEGGSSAACQRTRPITGALCVPQSLWAEIGTQEWSARRESLIECRCRVLDREQKRSLMDLKAGNAFAAIVLALLIAATAAAQLGDEIPHGSYYAAVRAVYS